MEIRLICQFLLVLISAKFASSDERDIDENEGKFREEVTTENTAVATTESLRQSRWYRGYDAEENERGYHHDDDEHDDDHDEDDDDDLDVDDMGDMGDSKAMVEPKGDVWGGYYDFLINEGSYKFWAVFQLATAALLIYSGFAAIYYAKVNPPTGPDYEDYFLRRRRRRRRSFGLAPQERNFLGLRPENFQRIIDAIAKEFH
ncbi:pheromone-processing carboxypeptidase KEX1 [Belonocnema kinseyi]|uniref:pheromone-processing carboxypeptidase KEX1 n=1 Tax=Belonocnema kinseyi TaxID=2817044 RepID=UPI00143CF412|nr:pheromone-processing carboxypeptidase KEX1 [Belonocnema kinseyi]